MVLLILAFPVLTLEPALRVIDTLTHLFLLSILPNTLSCNFAREPVGPDGSASSVITQSSSMKLADDAVTLDPRVSLCCGISLPAAVAEVAFTIQVV